ncbi:MAG: FliA/WhiG family RNA polymerase sigma factor [Deltaproteobacteria bacterium]|nr:FliA/WhiG family RNA polymerase sigma factor [Deltaproteobacteria bacterium]
MEQRPPGPKPAAFPAVQPGDSVEDVVTGYLPLVERMARHLHRRLPSGHDLGALVNSGVVGLLEALERYDPERGVSFHVYARHRIYGEMIQCLRSLDWVSRSIRAWTRRVAAVRRRLAEHLCREATSEEMAQELEVPLETWHRISYRVREQGWVSLDDPSWGGADVLLDGTDSDQGLYQDPLACVERQDLVDKLKRAVALLPERERLVVTLRHYRELKFREIGEGLGLTEGRICQIYVQARKRLRKALDD